MVVSCESARCGKAIPRDGDLTVNNLVGHHKSLVHSLLFLFPPAELAQDRSGADCPVPPSLVEYTPSHPSVDHLQFVLGLLLVGIPYGAAVLEVRHG